MLTAVKSLIKFKADVNIRNKKEESSLHWAAAFNSSSKIAKALIKAGAGINALDQDKKTPLHRAVDWKINTNIVNTLIQAGADPCLQDNTDKVPMDYVEYYKKAQQLSFYEVLKTKTTACGL